MRRAWKVALLATAVVAVACGRNEAAPSGGGATTLSAETAAAAPRSIEVVEVVERPLDVQLSLPSELIAYQTVDIHPRVSGFVKSVTVDRGSKVAAGQVLAVLEAPEIVAQRAEAESKRQAAEATLAAARASADAARTTFERLRAASATPGVVAGNDVVVAQKAAEAAASQVQAAERSVDAAREAANAVRDMEAYLRVTAPFAGVIVERNVHPGALVGPAGAQSPSPMLRLVDSDRLRLVVPVPEAYTDQIVAGAAIPFTVAAFPGESFNGTLARTMAVELDVENRGGRLSPGMFAQVGWPVRRTNPSLFVPSSSIASTTGRTFVVRVRGGKAEWVDVKTGLSAGSLVEVFGDLGRGDQIAERGTDELRPGTVVTERTGDPR
jgi:RND family efflux transporter MFP subunit